MGSECRQSGGAVKGAMSQAATMLQRQQADQMLHGQTLDE